MTAIAAPLRSRTWFGSYAASYSKGIVLSHLLGLIIASQFIVSGAAHWSVPYVKFPLNTAWLDFPLRALALWLILDRNWRVGRTKFSAWDALALGFPILVGLAYPFSLADASTGAGADGYKSFVGDMIRFYTVFVLVREAHLRAGFNGRIMLTWLMTGLGFSACLAILQALNVGGIRTWSERFFDQQRTLDMTASYRARGTAQHWNEFSSHMVVAFLIAVSALHWRKLKWWEWGLAGLFVAGVGVSTSRGGYATLFVTMLFCGIFFLATRRLKLGGTIVGGLALALIAFAGIVVSAKVERFNDLLRPPKVESADLGSLKYRMEQSERLMRVGMQHPLFGTGPSEKLYSNRLTDFYSTASVQGAKDATYPLLFAQFGLVGLAYMALLVAFFVRFLMPGKAAHPYALLAFGTGIALAVHSFSEMLLLTDLMYLVSVVAALAVTRFRPVSLPSRRRDFYA